MNPRPGLHIGTSGFSYPEWRGNFYPEKLPAAGMLAEYATKLNAVELNNTFFRFPRPEAIASWMAATNDGFRFCLKAQRSLTYSNPKFPRGAAAADFGSSLAAFEGRTGPVLIQFPPAFKKDLAALDELLGNLGHAAAVEFRDAGWLGDDTYEVARAHGAAIVVTDQEDWPRAPRVESAPFAYYRLRRDYSEAEVRAWAEEIRSELRARSEVQVFLRHAVEAPQRALLLRAALSAEVA